jgi:hypothetical protein
VCVCVCVCAQGVVGRGTASITLGGKGLE